MSWKTLWSILQLIHGCIMLHPKNTWCAGSFIGAPWNADSNGLLGVTPPWMKQRSAWNIREKASRSELQRNGMRSIATCYSAGFIRPPVAWGAITFSKAEQVQRVQVKKANGVQPTWFDIWDLGKAHARLGWELKWLYTAVEKRTYSRYRTYRLQSVFGCFWDKDKGV